MNGILSSERVIIEKGETSLGIEFGSTRIKSVLTDSKGKCLAKGGHIWENKYENGIWTYGIDDMINGMRDSYRDLADNVFEKYGVRIKNIRSIGISGMMHGYLVFDKDYNLLTPFRTWRNICTERASEILTKLFDFNIPQRWSVAHLYQSVLNKEPHVKDIKHMTTLAGYIHFRLTGENVLGVGEASGVFPIDEKTLYYNKVMEDKFNSLLENEKIDLNIRDIIPTVKNAGEEAGRLTEEGAKLLDISGNLQAGAVFCPPEGDAGTGMVATNSVDVNTGNISAGTSIFAMVVLDRQLSELYTQIDMVTTPDGHPVAMVHCNNCTSQLDAWANVFYEYAKEIGSGISKPQVYDLIYNSAAKGEYDCGGLILYNYLSGEHTVGINNGCPLFLQQPDSKINFQNYCRSLVYSAVSTLCLGMGILKKEKIKIKNIVGHGGLFITPKVAQQIMSSALDTPVTVMKTAGEGGAWGIALLSLYTVEKKDGESLSAFLQRVVFADMEKTTAVPCKEESDGFNRYLSKYGQCLDVERKAVDILF